MMFPFFHAQMVTEGLRDLFPAETPLTLSRSGWAGQQRFGVANWNGDLDATWENFQKTIVAGLNAQLSGMAWWTHDIGAIGGCDVRRPSLDSHRRAVHARAPPYGRRRLPLRPRALPLTPRALVPSAATKATASCWCDGSSSG